MSDGDEVVRAAGGVVWRRRDDGEIEVLLVHRPKYGDWSFPKGKCYENEDDPTCAVREVEEESGVRGQLGDELPSTEYVDPRGRPKRVRYWAMTVESGRSSSADPAVDAFIANDEVDDIRWCAAVDAPAILSYPRDVEVFTALTDRLAGYRPPAASTEPA